MKSIARSLAVAASSAVLSVGLLGAGNVAMASFFTLL
ncbi:hypothetical protein BH09ACT6_BH09ACT6_06140 [soil metagenome]